MLPSLHFSHLGLCLTSQVNAEAPAGQELRSVHLERPTQRRTNTMRNASLPALPAGPAVALHLGQLALRPAARPSKTTTSSSAVIAAIGRLASRRAIGTAASRHAAGLVKLT